MSLAVAVLPAYLRTPRDAVWLGRGVDRRGQQAPEWWRDPPAPSRRDVGAS